MSYIAKVSLPGHDVKTARPEDCSVHSDYPPLKAKLNQTDPHYALLRVNFTGGISQGTNHTLLTFPHGYDYTPLTLSSITLYSGSSVVVSGIGYAGVGANLEIKAYATASDFIIYIYDNFNWINSSSMLEVSYYIFAENGT